MQEKLENYIAPTMAVRMWGVGHYCPPGSDGPINKENVVRKEISLIRL